MYHLHKLQICIYKTPSETKRCTRKTVAYGNGTNTLQQNIQIVQEFAESHSDYPACHLQWPRILGAKMPKLRLCKLFHSGCLCSKGNGWGRDKRE